MSLGRYRTNDYSVLLAVWFCSASNAALLGALEFTSLKMIRKYEEIAARN
jgi:hypothetical protein